MVAEDLHILDIAENDRWVGRSVDVLQAAIEQAIRLRGMCLIGLSGGSTPNQVFQELATRPVAWENVVALQVDERVAPIGSPDRNLTAQQAAFSETDIQWVPLPVEDVLRELNGSLSDPLSLANVGETNLEFGHLTGMHLVRDVLADFDAQLVELAGSPPILDVVHLGLGTDGHTASLVPGDKAVNELLLYSALTGMYQGTHRITLTRPVMDRARMVVWLVRGASKREQLGRLLAGDMTIPAGLIRPAHSVIIADSDSACQT